MYTQCPACNTLFRISEKQLSAAKGKVRCGKCDHIYNAQGTLLDSLPSEPAPTVAEKTKPATPPVKKPVVATKPPAPIIENDEILEIFATENLSDSQEVSRNDIDLTDDAITDKDEPATDGMSSMVPPKGVDVDDWQAVDLGGIESDEEDSWFDDDEDSSSSLVPPSGVDKDDWQSVDLGSGDTDDHDSWFDDDHGLPEDDETKDDLMKHVSDYLDDDAADELISEEKASDILEEVQEQLSFSVAHPQAEEDEPSSQGIQLSSDWLNDFDEPVENINTSRSLDLDEEEELNDAILKSMEQPYIAPKSQPAEKQPEPESVFNSEHSIVLESDQHSEHKIGQHDTQAPPVMNDAVPLRLRSSINIEPGVPRSGLRWLLIVTSIIALLVMLFAQAILFRSTEFANMRPEYQSVLNSLCENLPCRDASRQDINQVQLMNRNISQHPKVKTALLIKAAIINRANFAQRYPNIQINLSDLTGSTVAQRIFTPKEYLGSLYNPFLQMKPGKPVHIALEVLDPGSTAINFEFKFL